MKNIYHLLILILTFIFCLWTMLSDIQFYKDDGYAIAEWGHVAFGLGVGSFLILIRKPSLKIAFVFFVIWEIYEEIFFFPKPHTIPLDTLLDIFLGMFFSWYMIKVIK